MKYRNEEEELNLLSKIFDTEKEIWSFIESQFNTLYTRAQTIFAMGALGITVTGFSGHRVIRSGPLSSVPLVLGLVFLLSALILSTFSLTRVRWLSSLCGKDNKEILKHLIYLRNKKTKRLNIALAIIAMGLFFYVAAMSNFLIQASVFPVHELLK